MTYVLQRNKWSAQTGFQGVDFGKILSKNGNVSTDVFREKKRKFWNKKQEEIDNICQDDSREFLEID